MNLLIEELIEQAGIQTWEDENSGCTVFGGDNAALLEQFADLIVEECVSNLRLNGYDDAAETIVKHFGEENDN